MIALCYERISHNNVVYFYMFLETQLCSHFGPFRLSSSRQFFYPRVPSFHPFPFFLFLSIYIKRLKASAIMAKVMGKTVVRTPLLPAAAESRAWPTVSPDLELLLATERHKKCPNLAALTVPRKKGKEGRRKTDAFFLSYIFIFFSPPPLLPFFSRDRASCE